MERAVTIIGKNGVEYTVSLTAEQADYYLRLAQLRASSPNEVMHEFAELIISKSKQDTQQNKQSHHMYTHTEPGPQPV